MKHLQPIKSLFLSLIILVCFTSCTKDDVYSGEQLASITVKLKSTVGNYDKVYIEIEDVQLKVKEDENASNAWISLNTINTGTYNAFDLRGDSELLLVDNFEMKAKYIFAIRLVLGDNNYIDINNGLHSCDVSDLGNSKPSNLVQLELDPNHIYDFEIDLDIDKSISFDEEQNTVILNPEIYTEIRKF
ncbi:DUF4382 domain-containing protein [uncultured Winogradskyella sp.]|uniref:DUF4382 domain-containing protein n=1 Tax=uncultured Winogradskyella sp. TaxID=395353 RepID=UPI00261A1A3F|nr:DUF4382 domain-containing protein [uncultured Winogradskyella sp.]